MEPEDLHDEIEAELAEAPQPEVVEEPPPLVEVDNVFDTVVDEVIQGKWGKGQDRRLRLSQAGYDHVAVQKEIIRRTNTK